MPRDDAEAGREAATLASLTRAARARRGWSQRDLARYAGVDLATLRAIEAGRAARPSPRALGLLAAALGLPVAAVAHAVARDAESAPGAAPGALAALVRAARTRRGWAGRMLAERAGVDLSTVRAIEAGRVRGPRPRTLARLAAALDLPLATLAGAAAQDAGGTEEQDG